MTEWENQFKIGQEGIGKGLKIIKEHILDTSDSALKIGGVRSKFLDWLDETIRIGNEMNSKLEAVHVLLRKSDGMNLSDQDVIVKLMQDITEASGEYESSQFTTNSEE